MRKRILPVAFENRYNSSMRETGRRGRQYAGVGESGTSNMI